MHVAIAIVSYRTADDVALCLEALARQTHRDFEVVICENGGAAEADKLRGRVGDVLPVTVIAADNPGYAGGLNRCFEAAPTADAYWVLNPDTQPEPDALAAMVAALDAGAGDVIGGAILEADGSIASLGGRWTPWLGRMVSIGKHAPASALPALQGQTDDLDYVSGACILVPRRVLDRIGPLREDYFLYAEEVEWLWRARKAGFRIVVAPQARVVHHQGSATGSADELRSRPRLPIYLNARNIVNLTRDTRAAPVPVAALMLAAKDTLKYARGGAWRQVGYTLSGIWAGLRDERGKPGWLP